MSRLTLRVVNNNLYELGYAVLRSSAGYYYFSALTASAPGIGDSILGGSPRLNAWTLGEIRATLHERIQDFRA